MARKEKYRYKLQWSFKYQGKTLTREEKKTAYPETIKQLCKDFPECRILRIENLPQYYENVEPAWVKDVTDHITLNGDGNSYVLGLTKEEREQAIKRKKAGLAPLLAARIQFRKGARWYWIHAYPHEDRKETKVEYVYKTYIGYRIHATPIRSKEIKAYLDKQNPKGVATRVEPKWGWARNHYPYNKKDPYA